MNRRTRGTGISLLAIAACSLACAQSVDTRIGKIDLQAGYPSEASVTKLYDELDFQRAVQVYIWAIPTVALDSLRIANKRDWGVDYNGVGIVDRFTTPAVVALTGNSTTIYAASFINLERDGPVVVDSPPGAAGDIVRVGFPPLTVLRSPVCTRRVNECNRDFTPANPAFRRKPFVDSPKGHSLA